MKSIDRYTIDYYRRDSAEYCFERHGLLRPDQLAAWCYVVGAPFHGDDVLTPVDVNGTVYSIGCGAGALEEALEIAGYDVVGIDPSPGAKRLYRGARRLDAYPGGGDCVIFCESIEHLTYSTFERTWAIIPHTARVVIVNWHDRHPIEVDGTGWDHVRQVDDGLYDSLSFGRNVLVRRGSHLVLE